MEYLGVRVIGIPRDGAGVGGILLLYCILVYRKGMELELCWIGTGSWDLLDWDGVYFVPGLFDCTQRVREKGSINILSRIHLSRYGIISYFLIYFNALLNAHLMSTQLAL